MNNTIKEEQKEYYEALEDIRKSGIVNMWGAAPYLEQACGITNSLAEEVLVNWIHNYDELAKKYNWR